MVRAHLASKCADGEEVLSELGHSWLWLFTAELEGVVGVLFRGETFTVLGLEVERTHGLAC
jgi:hypothetical protein